MPTVKLDARFSSEVKDVDPKLKQIKANMRKHFTDKFGKNLDIKQEVITTGDPDGMGELTDDVIVVRTKAEVSIEQGLEIKKMLAKQDESI